MTEHGGSIEWPHLERYSDIPLFNTKAVVQQTGVPAPTLRAWERRYQLIAPERAHNAYRLYSERDIALIRWLNERIAEGMAISHAIALFRHLNEGRQQPTKQTPPNHMLPDPPAQDPMFQVAISSVPPPTGSIDQQTPEDMGEQFQTSHWPTFGGEYPQSGYPLVHNMRTVQAHLIEVFRHFDEQTANTIIGSMMAIYPVERICLDLITPTLHRVGQLWAEGQMTLSVEHFASNFFRAVLTNLFHVTPSVQDRPSAIVGCAPGEPHEVAALMLALFLRRQGFRVIYLGQSVETVGLLDSIQVVTPDLVCISLTIHAYLPALINLGRLIQCLPPPRPHFVFGGQFFSQQAHTIPQVSGIYIDGDLQEVASKLLNMVREGTNQTK